MKEEIKEMPFGKKFRVGNFECFKITKTLSKKEINALRDNNNIPHDVRKFLGRGGLPYIMVNTISGSWSLCIVYGTMMYHLIEQNVMDEENGKKVLSNLFMTMYSDTSIVGDKQYWKDKGEALKAFMERTKQVDVSKKDDDETLADLQKQEEAKAAVIDMAKEVADGE